MSQPDIPSQSLLILVSLVCTAVLVLFVISLENVITDVNEKKNFLVTFNEDLIFSDENLTIIVDNNNSNKPISIYGLDNKLSSTISASSLVDESGITIHSTDIKFNNEQYHTIKNFDERGWASVRLSVNVTDLPPGSYQGWIVISGEINDTIPLVISTQPMTMQAIILVLIGVVLSVWLWEIIKYYKQKNNIEEKESIKGKLDEKLNAASKLRIDMQNKSSKGVTIEEYEIKEYDIEEKRLLGEAQVLAMATTQKQIEIEDGEKRVKTKAKTGLTILIIEFVSSIIGITIGLFTLLSSENVTGLLRIDTYEVIYLLGLGLGAGSLKELVDK